MLLSLEPRREKDDLGRCTGNYWGMTLGGLWSKDRSVEKNNSTVLCNIRVSQIILKAFTFHFNFLSIFGKWLSNNKFLKIDKWVDCLCSCHLLVETSASCKEARRREQKHDRPWGCGCPLVTWAKNTTQLKISFQKYFPVLHHVNVSRGRNEKRKIEEKYCVTNEKIV